MLTFVREIPFYQDAVLSVPEEVLTKSLGQCKEIEENNTMGKTKDLFKKIGAIKGTFHARMDTVKDRNSKDIAEAKEIKKKWQEYTEEL